MRAHWPVQLLFAGVSAVNAYSVETTPFTAPASARILVPPLDSDSMVAVPGAGLPSNAATSSPFTSCAAVSSMNPYSGLPK
jgi:hypothetical protein